MLSSLVAPKADAEPIANKLEGLQAGRAIAALSVAYFHSYVALREFSDTAQHPIPFLKDWGYLGVNFFFAISGYVICLVIAKRSFTIRSFFIKRFFRLYPLYWAVMGVCALVIWVGHFPDPVTFRKFIYSMTLLPQNGPPAYAVSWTLEREIVFYVLAGLTIPFVGVAGLIVLLAGLAWAGLVYGNPWSYHLISTHHADFLGGVLVFVISQSSVCRRSSVGPRWPRASQASATSISSRNNCFRLRSPYASRWSCSAWCRSGYPGSIGRSIGW